MWIDRIRVCRGEYQATVVPKQIEHPRNRSMKRRLTGVVEETGFVDLILADFSRVLHVIMSKDLIKGRRFSGYNYYIIRLCSRRGVELLPNGVKDLRKGKTKDTFHNNLFGVVYRKLAWLGAELGQILHRVVGVPRGVQHPTKI